MMLSHPSPWRCRVATPEPVPLAGVGFKHEHADANHAPGAPRTSRADDADATTGCHGEMLTTDFGVRVRPGRFKSP